MAKNGETACNVAVADFLRAPHIDEFDISRYNGSPGSYIRVRAVDDFRVSRVTVTIQNADRTEVEHGDAVLQPGTIWWRFTAMVENSSYQGDKIVVRVSDVPGNVIQKEADI